MARAEGAMDEAGQSVGEAHLFLVIYCIFVINVGGCGHMSLL